MNPKLYAGLLLLVSSYGQLLVPRRVFTSPQHVVHGYPILPATILAASATLFTLGVIVASEGVCEKLAAPSLGGLLWRDPAVFAWTLVAASAAGLTMELFAQWLGKLWIYPYWTTWFYGIVLLPGFAFYWLSIAASYLAGKAVFDTLIKRSHRVIPATLDPIVYGVLGVAGLGSLGIVAWLELRWYTHHGGQLFAVTSASPDAPPFGYALLALVGLWLVMESALRRLGRPSFIDSLLRGYWAPAAALTVSAVVVALVMESQNAANGYWAYTHVPDLHLALLGTPVVIFAAWPLQYVSFLVTGSLVVPALASLFWRERRVNA